MVSYYPKGKRKAEVILPWGKGIISYMATKPPFTFTPNIVRYLSTVIDLHQRRLQGAPPGHDLGDLHFNIPTYLDEEDFFSFSEKMRLSFVEYIKRGTGNKVWYGSDEEGNEKRFRFMHDRDSEWSSGDPERMKNGMAEIPCQSWFIIKDVKPLLFLWKYYLSQKDKPLIEILDSEFERMTFDDKDGRLSYLNKSYTFHRGKDRKATRLQLFKKLWDERMHIVNNETTKPGKPLTMEALTKRLGSTPLKSDIFNLESALKRKGMPIRVQKDSDSVLLIVDEHI